MASPIHHYWQSSGLKPKLIQNEYHPNCNDIGVDLQTIHTIIRLQKMAQQGKAQS